jgi:glyoxylase I family protein
MTTVTQPRLHHLALTVTDLDASVQWYGDVFDVHPILDVPHQGGVGRILADADRDGRVPSRIGPRSRLRST